MFYSQFILAKKGPLGTIWIAAHLERKLRKNQVADTDIGVSVDSILCPDVPIALRLSSHLLVGVVRIYSRKVNYLFHDCSEALLKIKQAFRSTVVDLPPEESTAPYHSITLPETFDLDDFELPDSAFLHGNFVDHHVSTREQITLQDTTDGTGYSTSQFGLDETFGDGGASQIGLDLDEELFFEKAGASLHNASNQVLSEAKTGNANMDIDADQDEDEPMADKYERSLLEGSYNLQSYNIQTPDLNEVFSSQDIGSPSVAPNEIDISHPSMGGPVTDRLENHNEVPQTPICTQQTPALDHQEKPPSSNFVGDMPSSSQQESDCLNIPNENANISSFLPQSDDPCIAVEATPDDGQKSSATVEKTADELHPDTRLCSNDTIKMHETESIPDPISDSACVLKKCTTQTTQVCPAPCEGQSISDNPPTEEMLGMEKVPQANGSSFEAQEKNPDTHKGSDQTPLEKNEDVHKPDGLAIDTVCNNPQLDGLHCSASSDYPEPEKMLRAPNEDPDAVNDMEQYTAEKGVTESDGSVDRLQSLSGKKRCLAEDTPALLADEGPRLKRNTKFIPEDDDVLASILGGRRSNASKLTSTTPLQIIPSSKRPRLTKMGGPKRKVLLDDTMVLHADAIRQQLMNTEGIRRIRKKAPCTDLEIWMIQKCLSEEDIFGEPVLTGISPEFASLHYKIYDPEERLFPVTDATHSGLPKLDARGASELSGEVGGVGGPAGNVAADKSANMIHENSDVHMPSTLRNGSEEDLKLTIDKLKQNLSSSGQACSVVSEEMQICDGRDEGFIESNIVIGDNLFSENQTEWANTANPIELTSPVRDDLHFHEKQGMEDSAQLPKKYYDGEPPENLNATKYTPALSETVSGIVENGIATTSHQDCETIECENVLENIQQIETRVGVEGQALSPSHIPESGNVTGITPSNVGENSCLQESNIESAMNAEYTNEMTGTRGSCDFGSGVGGNDTEFLNMDDEVDFGEDANYDVPNPEEAQSLENSGWSARTRGVARYLKSLFDEESGCGRKVVSVDRLLVGKSRKEASRMFFETLVLKTRDYIHVEQQSSFRNIDIRPRPNLLKSEF